MGKSALALCMAANLGVRQGIPVGMFTLEMSKSEVTQRLMCSEAKVESQRLRTGKLAPDDWPRLTAACDKLAKAPIYVDDTGSINMMEIRSKARRLKSRHPDLGLVVVDYLQLMSSAGTVENRVQEVSQISRSLKILARDLEVPIVALSQLSRAVEQRTDKRPILSDLRESGCLTGDTPVYLPDTGEHRPIRDLMGCEGTRVLALDTKTWKLEPKPIVNAFCTGRKPVYRLTTRLGRTIRATGNHKFLAFDGWRRLDDLAPEMRIALPRELPGPSAATMTDSELALLGHLIGDGCTLPRHAIQYTTKDYDLANMVALLADDVFGDAVAPRVKAERRWYQVYLPATAHLTHGGEGKELSGDSVRLDERGTESRRRLFAAPSWHHGAAHGGADAGQRSGELARRRPGPERHAHLPPIGRRRRGTSGSACRGNRAAACFYAREHEPRRPAERDVGNIGSAGDGRSRRFDSPSARGDRQRLLRVVALSLRAEPRARSPRGGDRRIG